MGDSVLFLSLNRLRKRNAESESCRLLKSTYLHRKGVPLTWNKGASQAGSSFPKEHIDHRVRLAGFEWLEKQTHIHGDVLPRELLVRGFVFEGTRVPLVSPQGIFKPKILPEIPLSISTTPESPYKDSVEQDNLFLYSYRGTDPQHRDNVGLRKAMVTRIRLIYFLGIVQGKYLAVWPVFIVHDDPANLAFKVAADDLVSVVEGAVIDDSRWHEDAEPRRAYITGTARQRLHQRGFCERVLPAYREQCACCRLKRLELLDAAHIIADSKPEGMPAV